MDYRITILIGVIKRFALPVAIGTLILWLANHGYNNWIPIICDITNNFGIIVTECKSWTP